MIEAVVAVALVAVGIGAVMGAALAVQHQTATAQRAAALTLEAQNVLADLRATTAYDAAALDALPGRSVTFDVGQAIPDPSASAQPLHVVTTVARAAAGAPVVATVTIRDAAGHSATVQSTLVYEAPPPGSAVPAATPDPSATAPPADLADPGTSEPVTPPSARCDVGADCASRGPIRL